MRRPPAAIEAPVIETNTADRAVRGFRSGVVKHIRDIAGEYILPGEAVHAELRTRPAAG